jgi:hypothetical protein
VSDVTIQRAFELGVLAMRQLAEAKCGNLTESLSEGLMTDAGLTDADRIAMRHQIVAIGEVWKEIGAEGPKDAARYGSYILASEECRQIKSLFPDLEKKGAA